MVYSEMGTKRCLSPFPVTLIKPSSKNRSDSLRSRSSETLRPQPYNVSMIARLRSPSFLLRSTAAMILSTSSIEMVSGSSCLSWVIPLDPGDYPFYSPQRPKNRKNCASPRLAAIANGHSDFLKRCK